MVVRTVVVDDHPDNRFLMTLSLDGEEDFTCLGAYANIEDARRFAPWHEVDVAVIDVMMGSAGSGVDLGWWLRENYPHVIQVAWTASAVHLDESRAWADASVDKGHTGRLLNVIRQLHADRT